ATERSAPLEQPDAGPGDNAGRNCRFPFHQCHTFVWFLQVPFRCRPPPEPQPASGRRVHTTRCAPPAPHATAAFLDDIHSGSAAGPGFAAAPPAILRKAGSSPESAVRQDETPSPDTGPGGTRWTNWRSRPEDE